MARDYNEPDLTWAPPESDLDAPECPPGFVQRWIRVVSSGKTDKMNLSRRIREGWKPVPGDEYPGYPTDSDGNISVGDSSLFRWPAELNRQRNDYYARHANEAVRAESSNLRQNTQRSGGVDPVMTETKVKHRVGRRAIALDE